MARQLQSGIGEERALAYVMIACFVFFVASLPALARQNHLDPNEGGFAALAGGALLGATIMAPLMFYGIAAVSRLVAMVFSGNGTWLRSRLALFWSLLAITPMMLLRGLTEAFTGQSPALSLVNIATAVLFGYLWFNSMRAAEASQ